MTAAERWAILACIPKVATDKEAKDIFRPDLTDLSFAWNAPPRVSVLTLPPGVTAPPSKISYPYVAAADSSGLLLLSGKLPHTNFSSLITYHLCDATTGEIVPLSRHRRPMGFHRDNVGLIVTDRGCVVAELQPESDGTATLLCYMVGGECQWVQRELAYSPPLSRFFGEGVLTHAGMLWWVDLSYGLLACDPFAADVTELLHVPLPQATAGELPATFVNRGSYRCVRVSGGRLRCVQIHGSPDAPVVSMWALAAPASAGKWNLERSVPLADVWVDETYRNTALPGKLPALALLHPVDPDRLYFFLGTAIFAVDLRLKKVVEFSDF